MTWILTVGLLLLACFFAFKAWVHWTIYQDLGDKVVWDRTINSERDGLPVLYIKNLLHWRGRRIDLHKIVYPDPWGCFHSHPARAIRLILAGGYVEELLDGRMVKWWSGRFGLVKHDTVHRINRLRSGAPSYSLWIRGKVRHPTGLFGEGWPVELQNTYHGSSES